jgi:dephospho-CoA kinase
VVLSTIGGKTVAATDKTLDEVTRRLEVRGDTFLDSDGEELFAELRKTAAHDADAAKALKEIKHRRSEKIE